MHSFDTALLEHHLRRLDGESLAALVADLWAARGYETIREGGTVLATHDSTTVRIRVSRVPAGHSEMDATDVVVAPDGVTDRHGDTRVVDAAALAELLSYAVDRTVTRELCERYLGTPPSELPPPPLTRARRQTARIVDGAGSTVLVGLVVAVVVGFALLVGTPFAGDAESVPDRSVEESVVTPVGTSGDERVRERADEGPLEDDDTTGATEPFPSQPTTPPPGVSEEGITDLEALASAHERAMANRSHTIRLGRYSRQKNVDNRSVKHDIDMITDGERYLVTTTLIEPDNRQRLETFYYDGRNHYEAVRNETTEYDREARLDEHDDPSPTPGTVRETLVWRYLSTENSSVTRRTARGGSVVYRVVGTGQADPRGFDHVWNYSVVALIDSRGFVRNLSVEFDARASSRYFHVRHEITYDRIGSTAVEAPAWYEHREGNATAG